jgi:hypothetical protein
MKDPLQKQIEQAENKVKALKEKLRRKQEQRFLLMGKFIEEQDNNDWNISIDEIKTKWSELNK